MSHDYRILLVNPWIYDVAAHDFWNKPLGLLSLAALLDKAGIQMELLDCLDRFDPELSNYPGIKIPKGKKCGTGRYVRERIVPPSVLNSIDRQYSRYGFPLPLVVQKLRRMKKPDIILITSSLTYWYPAVKEIIQLLRGQFPGVPILLGGIYASLCPQHAERESGADLIFSGEAERKLFDLVRGFFPDFPGESPGESLDDYPFPAYHLYPHVQSIPLLTSRGCPFRCSFCASRLLAPGFRRRSVDHVVEELLFSYRRYHVRHIAFYDDALLVDADHHIKQILRAVIARKLRLEFHTPNGLHPKFMDQELAELMVKGNFTTVRFSFETGCGIHEQAIDRKVTPDDLANAVDVLEKAGYPRKKIEVYILTGLPNQSIPTTLQDMWMVHELGVKIRLAQFSPIPGTTDWENAVKAGMDAAIDLLLTNNSFFARQWGEEYYHLQQKCLLLARVLNYAIDLDLVLGGKRSFLKNF